MMPQFHRSKRVIKKGMLLAWYLLAAGLIFLAFVVSIARGITPQLNKHKQQFAAWAGQQLNQSIKIGQMRAWFQGFSPEIVFRDVSILDRTQKTTLTHIKELQVDINVLRSILTFQLQPSQIHVVGTSLSIHQQSDGTYQIQGFQQHIISGGEDNNHDFLEWIFSRKALVFSDVQIDFYGKDKSHYPLIFDSLKLVNKGKTHECTGLVRIQKFSEPTVLNFNLSITGVVDQLKEADISLYLSLKQIDLKDWLKGRTFKQYQLQDGTFTGDVWLHIDKGQLERAQTLFDAYNVVLQQKGIKQSFVVKYLKGNAALLFDTDRQWKFTLQFNPLSIPRWNGFPGVENASGIVELNEQNGQFSIQSNQVQLDFGKLFPQSLSLEKLLLQGRWLKRFDQSWEISVPHFEVVNDQIALNGQAGLLLPSDFKNPVLSVSAGFDLEDLSTVKNYLPVGIFTKNLTRWLNAAFVEGQDAQGTVVIRGPIDDFPFGDRMGTFIVDSQVHDLQFHFAPGWPNLEHVDSHLVFHNRSMVCDAIAGQAYGITLHDAHAEIPVIGKANMFEQLSLQAHLTGDAQYYLDFIHHSPLEDSIGDDLQPFSMKGNAGLSLGLDVPLSTPEKTKVNGTIDLEKNTLKAGALNLLVNDINGQISFTENTLKSNPMTATIFDEPATLQLSSITGANPVTRLTCDSRIELEVLKKYLQVKDLPYLKGQTSYHAVLDMNTHKKNDSQNVLTVQSDLQGVEVDLPQPLGKDANSTMPINLKVWLGGQLPPQVLLRYGADFSAALNYKHVEKQLKLFSVNLHLGKTDAEFQKQPGLYIDGTLKTFDWAYWKNFYNEIKQKLAAQKNGAATSLQNQLRTIQVNIEQLNLFGLAFPDTVVSYQPQEDASRLSFKGSRVDGYVLIAKNYKTQGLTGIFKKLYLFDAKAKETPVKTDIVPSQLPPLTLQIDDFKQGKKTYGQVALIAKPGLHVYQLAKITLRSPLLKAEMQGEWADAVKGQYQSRLSGEFYSPNMTQLFKQWGMPSSVIASSGNANFQLYWAGPLYAPSLKVLNGNVYLKLRKGYIVDLGTSTSVKINLGRLLTLLDINRLLMMNFSSLTSPGYSFDNMSTHLQFKDGNVSTNDLLFDGSIAKILIKGTMNLVHKNLNLQLFVTPYLTSSLPVVATIAGGPIAGAITWLADKVVGQTVEKITTYQYRVTGTVEKPVIQKQ
ncbi:MAG: YhdP family protein [Pseudomonadota bacterium]